MHSHSTCHHLFACFCTHCCFSSQLLIFLLSFFRKKLQCLSSWISVISFSKIYNFIFLLIAVLCSQKCYHKISMMFLCCCWLLWEEDFLGSCCILFFATKGKPSVSCMLGNLANIKLYIPNKIQFIFYIGNLKWNLTKGLRLSLAEVFPPHSSKELELQAWMLRLI